MVCIRPCFLITFSLFCVFRSALPEEERLRFTQDMFRNSLPVENHAVLSYLMHFLQKVKLFIIFLEKVTSTIAF